ncbi:MAG TPA: c-type cytochrome [Sphingomonadaceae bacterium]|nr:c-type cytochrome [Sphingomonadaceae bacterium]
MRRFGLTGVIGSALLLGACGGGTEDEPAARDEAAAIDDVAEPSGDQDREEEASSETGEAAEAGGAAAPAAASSVAPAVAAAEPPASYNQCKVCHSVEPGEHGIGPSLAGIFGTRAGDIAGFEFSSAMKESGLVWNEANLDAYLLNPRGVVPGTKMAFAGLKDEAKRKEVIAYLKSL